MSAVPSMHLPVHTLVLGGSGYVAGECLRLLGQHPVFKNPMAISESRPNDAVAAAFPHLKPLVKDARFKSIDDAKHLVSEAPSLIVAAAPHLVSAELIDSLLEHAYKANQETKVVDLSADYRLSDAELYATVYGHAHPTPARLAQFCCGLPEQIAHTPQALVAHPGCFATSMLLSIWPLLTHSLTQPEFYCSGVTGSTGSGRKLSEGTHHPKRHSDLYSYNALHHRHSPEVALLLNEATGRYPKLHFVPHSGPFARGIHMTVQANLTNTISRDELLAVFRAAYAQAPFVDVIDEAPRLKDVVGTNYAHLSVQTDGEAVCVTAVIDNLIKGAAGGGVQWANRLYGLEATSGLTQAALGYT